MMLGSDQMFQQLGGRMDKGAQAKHSAHGVDLAMGATHG